MCKKFLKNANRFVCCLVILSLFLQFAPSSKPAQAFSVSDIGAWLKKLVTKVALPDITLTEEGKFKVGNFSLYEFDSGVNPFSQFKLKIDGQEVKSQIALVEPRILSECMDKLIEQSCRGKSGLEKIACVASIWALNDIPPECVNPKKGELTIPNPYIPEVCELSIPLVSDHCQGGADEKCESKILAKNKACVYLNRLQEAAAQETYSAFKIFNATDPFTDCLFVRNCRTNCSLRIGELSFTVSLLDVAALFVPGGFLTVVQKILNIAKMINEAFKIYTAIKTALTSGVQFLNDLFNVMGNLSAMFSSFANLGLKWSDVLIYGAGAVASMYGGENLKEIGVSQGGNIGWLKEKAGSALTAGDGLLGGVAASAVLNTSRVKQAVNGMQDMLGNFAQNNLKFNAAKTAALKANEKLKVNVDEIRGQFKAEPEFNFFFDPKDAKKEKLNNILGDFQLFFRSVDEFLNDIASTSQMKDGRNVADVEKGGETGFCNPNDIDCPIENRSYYCTTTAPSRDIDFDFSGYVNTSESESYGFCYLQNSVQIGESENCKDVNYLDVTWLDNFIATTQSSQAWKSYLKSLNPDYIRKAIVGCENLSCFDLGGCPTKPSNCEMVCYGGDDDCELNLSGKWWLYWKELAETMGTPREIIAQYNWVIDTYQTTDPWFFSLYKKKALNALRLLYGPSYAGYTLEQIKELIANNTTPKYANLIEYYNTTNHDTNNRKWVKNTMSEIFLVLKNLTTLETDINDDNEGWANTKTKINGKLQALQAEIQRDNAIFSNGLNQIKDNITYLNTCVENLKTARYPLYSAPWPFTTFNDTAESVQYWKNVWFNSDTTDPTIGNIVSTYLFQNNYEAKWAESYNADIAYEPWSEKIEILQSYAQNNFEKIEDVKQALALGVSPEEPIVVYKAAQAKKLLDDIINYIKGVKGIHDKETFEQMAQFVNGIIDQLIIQIDKDLIELRNEQTIIRQPSNTSYLYDHRNYEDCCIDQAANDSDNVCCDFNIQCDIGYNSYLEMYNSGCNACNNTTCGCNLCGGNQPPIDDGNDNVLPPVGPKYKCSGAPDYRCEQGETGYDGFVDCQNNCVSPSPNPGSTHCRNLTYIIGPTLIPWCNCNENPRDTDQLCLFSMSCYNTLSECSGHEKTGTSPIIPPLSCDSDGRCETGENRSNCPYDCGCNSDGHCDSARGENRSNCPYDCQGAPANGFDCYNAFGSFIRNYASENECRGCADPIGGYCVGASQGKTISPFAINNLKQRLEDFAKSLIKIPEVFAKMVQKICDKAGDKFICWENGVLQPGTYDTQAECSDNCWEDDGDNGDKYCYPNCNLLSPCKDNQADCQTECKSAICNGSEQPCGEENYNKKAYQCFEAHQNEFQNGYDEYNRIQAKIDELEEEREFLSDPNTKEKFKEALTSVADKLKDAIIKLSNAFKKLQDDWNATPALFDSRNQESATAKAQIDKILKLKENSEKIINEDIPDVLDVIDETEDIIRIIRGIRYGDMDGDGVAEGREAPKGEFRNILDIIINNFGGAKTIVQNVINFTYAKMGPEPDKGIIFDYGCNSGKCEQDLDKEYPCGDMGENGICPANPANTFLCRLKCFETVTNTRTFQQLTTYTDILKNIENAAWGLTQAGENIKAIEPSMDMKPVTIKPNLVDEVDQRTECCAHGNPQDNGNSFSFRRAILDEKNNPILDTNEQVQMETIFCSTWTTAKCKEKTTLYVGMRDDESNYEFFKTNLLANPLSALEDKFSALNITFNNYLMSSMQTAVALVRSGNVGKNNYVDPINKIITQGKYMWYDLIWGNIDISQEILSACTTTEQILTNDPADIENQCQARIADEEKTDLLPENNPDYDTLKSQCNALTEIDLDILDNFIQDPGYIANKIATIEAQRADIAPYSRTPISCPKHFCVNPNNPLKWAPASQDPACAAGTPGLYNNIIWDTNLTIGQRQWPPDDSQNWQGAQDLCLSTQQEIIDLQKLPTIIDGIGGVNNLKPLADNCNNLAYQEDFEKDCYDFDVLKKVWDNETIGPVDATDVENAKNAIKGFCRSKGATKGKIITETIKSGADIGTFFGCDGLDIDLTGLSCSGDRIQECQTKSQNAREVALKLCSQSTTDMRTPLNEIMKVFSVLLGVKSATVAVNGLSALYFDAQKVRQRAEDVVNLIKEAPEKFEKLWNSEDVISKIGKDNVKIKPVKCIEGPMISYASGDKPLTGENGGQVCPNVGEQFGQLDANFSEIRQNLRMIDMARIQPTTAIGFGNLALDIPKPDQIDPDLNEVVGPIYERAKEIKEKSQLLWALATAINYANENCTCGKSYCPMLGKIPLCISGLPLTLTPLKQPFCHLIWTLRYPLGSLAEKLKQELEQE